MLNKGLIIHLLLVFNIANCADKEALDESALLGTQSFFRAIVRRADLGPVIAEYRPYVNQRDTAGRAPIHWAIMMSNLSAVQALVNAGADLNMRASDSQSTISLACLYCDTAFEGALKDSLSIKCLIELALRPVAAGAGGGSAGAGVSSGGTRAHTGSYTAMRRALAKIEIPE